MTKYTSIPLNERKKARNKLALLDATVGLLKRKPLSEITIEELCEKTEISKGAFFAYFPRKVDVILFRIRIWSVEAVWMAKHEYGASGGLKLIEAVFKWTAEELFEDNPRLFSEVIAFRAFEPETFTEFSEDSTVMVGRAERALRFPDKREIESIPEGTLTNIIRENLQTAIQKGELPKNTDLEAILLALMSLFYGIPLMLGDRLKNRLSEAYSMQLNLLWRGLQHMNCKNEQ